MFKKGWLAEVMLILAFFCGVNAVSIGSTFAQPSEFRPVETILDRHADLMVAVGVGLSAVALLVLRLYRRIRALEDELRRIEKAAS